MMSLAKNECRKFAPNIFNKSKCQNCFACKDSHSAEALDNNRVSRKVSKCGYLFVAPDWDFSNPINRTKRWQRRWFVLFDDGELTYSVDEHPDTIPQALIDMTKVLEVSNAEELTGNKFAIAIIAPEKVHFVKGTSREESKWWYDVLSIFPRSIKSSRHKRNSTFPGGKASTPVNRPLENLNPLTIQTTSNINAVKSDDVSSDGHIVNVKNRKNSQSLSQTSAPLPALQSSNQAREKRIIKRRNLTPRSLSDGVSLMMPSEKREASSKTKTDTYIVTVTDSNKNEIAKGADICNKLTDPTTVNTTQDQQVPRLIDAKEKLGSTNHASTFSQEAVGFDHNHRTSEQPQKEDLLNVRGDPDGCGLDMKSITSASSHPKEQRLATKKGWLLRHNGNDKWVKVWCVLNDIALEYYEDSSSEVTGSSTAIVSLSEMCSAQTLPLSAQNGFQLEMKNGEIHSLSAITPNIRATWLAAIRSAVGYPCDDSTAEQLSSLGEKIEKEISSLTDAMPDSRPNSRPTSLEAPSSPRSVLSSDDEFKTASEASGRTEDYFEWADEDVDHSSTSRTLPPSPPLNRTPISRVKERARTRSNVRSGSQSDGNNGSKKAASSAHSGCKEEDSFKDDLSGSDRETYSTPKMQRRSNSRRRKDSSGSKSDIPESMMVELLESEVNSLKMQLTRCQQEISDLQHNKRFAIKAHKDETISFLWQQQNGDIKPDEKEKELSTSSDANSWRKKHSELLSHYQGLQKRTELLEQTCGFSEREQHLFDTCHRIEEKCRTEKAEWENEKKALDDNYNRLVCDQQTGISHLEDRLRQSESKMMGLLTEIEELESVVKKERLQKPAEADKMLDKLESTRRQVKSLKRKLEEAEEASDRQEMECLKMKQSVEISDKEHENQTKLMVERIEDLTSKLSAAEKQNRQIRQKLMRLENKEQKRTRSLKGLDIRAEESDKKSYPTKQEQRDDSVQLLVTINAEEPRKEKADDNICRSRSALQQTASFFKEKETTLAQLGLLNKQTQSRINLERMIYQSNLIGHTCATFRPTKGFASRWHKRRLILQLAAFDKKISSPEFSPGAVDETADLSSDLKSLRLRVQRTMNNYKSVQMDSLAAAMVHKATEKCVEKENENEATKVDVLAQKLTELEMKRVVSSIALLREREDAICSGMWMPDDDKMRGEMRTRLEATTNSVVDELQRRFRHLLQSVDGSKEQEGCRSNLDANLAKFVDVVAQECIFEVRLECLDDDIESGCEFDQLIDLVAQRELEIVASDVDKFVVNMFHASRLKTSESFADRSASRKLSMQDVLKSVSAGKPSFFLNSVESRTANRSFRQRGKRSVTMPIICSLETEQAVAKKECADCERLEREIVELREHELRNKNGALDLLEEKIALVKHLERQLRMAEQKLSAKEEENKQQIAALKEAYKQEASRKNDSSINEETVRQTYQTEIDQLRGLCEKGLVAMENSHRRIVSELEEKHQRELDQSKIEKEQALAEETQATLAALDAMRKAHETELQREIAKFKQEFLEKMQSTQELDALQKEQEEEIETIREEILSLSEKYSIKCLENASLEERLRPLLQQLTDANSLAFDLTARNKQLRAMLNLNNADLQSEIDRSNSVDTIDNFKLKLKESEVMEKTEEVADLKRMLRDSRRREDELADRHGQLDQSLKAERRMRQDEVSSLRDRLEHIILTSNATLEAAVAISNTELDPIISTPKTRRNFFGFKYRELMRSPSCPGLSNDTFAAAAAVECGGVVSSRKHLFEPGKSHC